MSTRILTFLVAAILVGGVMTAVLKDTGKEPSALPTATPTPVEPSPTPTETMTFDGAAPFETPTSVQPTATQTGGLPVSGVPAGWPPALAALSLAGVASLVLRRAAV